MKKAAKLLSLALSLCMMLSAFTFTVFAEDTSSNEQATSGTCGDNLIWTLDENGTLTISGEGKMDYSPTTPWESQKHKIKSVVIENGVTSIGNNAFGCCSSLWSVTISNSVSTIEDYAFYRCTSLRSIDLPDSVTIIGECVFRDSSFLQSVKLSSSLTTIGKHAFRDTFLFTVTIPESVTTICEYAFSYCHFLENVSIPKSVTFIGNSAFYDCTSLRNVEIPNPETIIEEYAFGYYCDYETETTVKNRSFVIYGEKDSLAEKYATENGLVFSEPVTFPEADKDEYIDTDTATMPNVVANTKAETIVSTLSKYGITATVTDKNGNVLSDTAKIGTGCKVKTADGNEYTVIVKGDVDGTGEIDSTDYLQIKKVFLGTNSLSDEYFTAADTDKSSDINSTDYLQIKQHFLGTLDLYA